MICPQCRGGNCFRSHRSGFWDFLGTLCGLRPWRCDTCDRRFYARTVAIGFVGYAHCPRCGNFDLDRVARDRVEGILAIVGRLLALPAYRCDPCRYKFFTLLPHRRIVPSVVTAPKRLRAS